MRRLSADQVRWARAARQGLGAARTANVVDSVRRVVGLQGQDVRANRLGMWVRSRGLTAVDVDDACRDRVVVRTWAMRGTLHMITAEDYWWVNAALGPYFAARGAPRRRQLGLDDDTLARAGTEIESVLREPLTRTALVERLGGLVDGGGQAPAHLLAWAANVGIVCRGPETGRDEPTYVLVRDWLGARPAIDHGDALATLAERYLAGYGPATAYDLAAWSGLPVTRARAAFAAIADRVETVDADGVESLVLAGGDVTHTGSVRLLGHFDTYLLGYRDRALAVPDRLAARVQTGGGFVMPTVLVDGLVVGTWRSTNVKDVLVVDTDTTITDEIRNEVADLGRFLGRKTELGTATR